MKYELIITKNNYSLIVRGTNLDEYAVVEGLNEEDGRWNWTVFYSNFGRYGTRNQLKSFDYCYQELLRVTSQNRNYINRARLEELATFFKDGLIEDDEESAMEYFDEVCEMTDDEKEYFGIGEDWE